MGAVARLLVLSVLVAVAGCLDPGPAALDGTPPTATRPLDLDLSADHCDGSAVIILVSPDRVEPYLAPGFHPRDAQDLLVALPIASGQVPVFVASMVCESPAAAIAEPHQVGFIGILVEPPAVAGFNATASQGYDVLSAQTIVPPLLLEALAPSGWDLGEGSLDSQATVLPNGGALVQVQANPVQGARYSYNLVLPAPIDDSLPDVGFASFAVRIWTDGPRGASVLEYVFTGDVPVGLGSCSFPVGSLAYNLTGSSNCFPGPQLSPTGNVAAAGLDVHVAGRFRHFPGAHAQ